tara:strand:+ start:143 stop:700 length:558 start_codon:yes stop_codon:yes gene_type:complete
MKIAERIVMIVLVLVLVGGGYGIYYGIQKNHQEVLDAVERGEYERPIEGVVEEVPGEDWRTIYPFTVPMVVGGVVVEASVADTMSSRIKGLSGTPFLPDHMVKLFAFGVPGSHSIWMKDMNYALDIIWFDEEGTIVHIEEDVSPDTFPESFSSPEPAWFVIEANAGFVASNTIAVGDEVILPVRQ